MTGRQADDALCRGEVLINLRHGIRQSSRLALQLAEDTIVGNEALALLGRLQAIRAEVDALAFSNPDPRQAQNDPFWNEPPHLFQRG